MSASKEVKCRAKYIAGEYKLDAVRLVKADQEVSVTARVLGIPKATLGNWISLAGTCQLQSAGEHEHSVSAEQMGLDCCGLNGLA